MFTKEQLSEICEAVIAENKKEEKKKTTLLNVRPNLCNAYVLVIQNILIQFLFPELRDYTIYIDGTSKCFAATGVRVGWSFGSTKVIDRMKALLTHVGAWAETRTTSRSRIFR